MRSVVPRHCRQLIAAGLLLAAAACGKDSAGNSVVASLRFISLPTSVAAGQTFTVVVELLNPGEERATDSRASVLLVLVGAGTLSGVTTLDAVAGVATFSGLTLTTAGTGVLLRAEAETFTETGAAFVVTAAAADAEQSTATAVETPLSPFLPSQLTFTFRDEFGNLIAGAPVSMTTSLAGSSLNPSSGPTNNQGRFITQFQPGGEGTVTFSATIGGASFTFTTSFAIVDPCSPAPFAFPGTGNGSVPTGTCEIDGRPATAFRFTASQPTGAAFTVTAPFLALFEVQTDPPTPNVRFAPDAGLTVEWLLPAGTYRFRVGSLAATGAFSFQGDAVAGNSDGLPRALVTGGTYTGQTITELDFPYGDGTFFDAYYISSTSACTITLNSTAFDAWLELVNVADGMTFADDDDSGGGTDAQLVREQCNANGAPMVILANNFNPAQRGPYTLVLSLQGPTALRTGVTTDAMSATVLHGMRGIPLNRASMHNLKASRRK